MWLAAVLLGCIGVVAACNGNDALCDRSFSNVTFVGSHNSAFVGPLPQYNQYISVTKQLDMGVRFLQAQTQNKDGTIEMCHTYCWLLDVGTLTEYLKEIKSWMDGHRRELVVLLLTNIDAMPVEQFADAFRNTELEKYVYRPPGGQVDIDEWPTLRQLIDDDTRLVVFMDYHADTSKVDYILDEFQHYWETPFGETDKNFPICDVDRPDDVEDPKNMMYIVNHFLDIELIFDIKIPDQISAPQTNSFESIKKQADMCRMHWDRTPNVILLDWIDVGDAMKVQKSLNRL